MSKGFSLTLAIAFFLVISVSFYLVALSLFDLDDTVVRLICAFVSGLLARFSAERAYAFLRSPK